jgi:hypothetical protein
MAIRPKLTIKSLGSIKADPDKTRIGEAFDDAATGINNLAAQLGADPNGGDVSPAQIAQVQVQHLGNGQIDIAILDNSSLSRAINYFAEYSQSPGFTNPYTLPMGPSRNNHTLFLPNGVWYFRGFSQYPAGGPPSSPVSAASGVVVSGSNSGVMYPAQGSGTGKPNTGGGQGAGKTLTR